MSDARKASTVHVCLSHFLTNIGANDGSDSAFPVLRNIAAAKHGLSERTGAAKKSRSGSFRLPHSRVNGARPEATA